MMAQRLCSNSLLNYNSAALGDFLTVAFDCGSERTSLGVRESN